MKAALAPELLYTYSPLHLYLWRLESLLLPRRLPPIPR